MDPTPTPAPGHALRNITYAVLLVLMIGFMLVIGQGIIIPILIALISVYIIGALDKVLADWKGTSWAPAWIRRLILILGFVGLLTGFTSLIIVTVQQLMQQAPSYQANLEGLVREVTRMLGFQNVPDWPTIYDQTIGRISLPSIIGGAASQLSSVGGMIFLTIIYVSFLFAEKARFGEKLLVAFPDRERAEKTMDIVSKVNTRIGQYLGTKTLINVILGVISYLIMLAFGLDYAPFWALLIGVLNYIPYIGSIVALLLPVGLSIVQFASLPMTLGLYAGLQLAQIAVGNFLEPSMVGRRVNLSAFYVLVALAFWGAIWGIVGAILAVPLTSMLVIIFNEIPALRPVAIMMSDNLDEFEAKPRKPLWRRKR